MSVSRLLTRQLSSAIEIDRIEGDGDGILQLRLAEMAGIAQQEIRKPDAGGALTAGAGCGGLPIELVSSGSVFEDLLVLCPCNHAAPNLKLCAPWVQERSSLHW